LNTTMESNAVGEPHKTQVGPWKVFTALARTDHVVCKSMNSTEST